MAEDELNQEQILFYEKVAGYVSRHPEFVEDILKRIEEEENANSASANSNYAGQTNYVENKEGWQNGEKSKKGIFKLDEEKINTISNELSGLLFKRDESNKSVLEKTLQDAFSGMVKNYLSKYAG